MAPYESVVCEVRYCPKCGTEIFCRTGSNNDTLYFISRAMEVEVQTCPQCHLDLIGVPIHALDVQSRLASAKKQTPQRHRAGIGELTDAAAQKAPEVFPTKSSARKVLKAMGEVVFDLLSEGVDVRFPGIGSLKIHERKARKGRNPSTGETLQIPSKKGVKFLPSKALREKLNP